MASGKLYVIGLGPGGAEDMSGRARAAIEACEVVAGYTVYVDLLREEFPDKEILTTPMRKEVERCRMALEEAVAGRKVAMVCSGDPGVYGMAGLIYELTHEYPPVDIKVIPGVSASNGGAAVLGAPLMHDYCVISLSDLLTPWGRLRSVSLLPPKPISSSACTTPHLTSALITFRKRVIFYSRIRMGLRCVARCVISGARVRKPAS